MYCCFLISTEEGLGRLTMGQIAQDHEHLHVGELTVFSLFDRLSLECLCYELCSLRITYPEVPKLLKLFGLGLLTSAADLFAEAEESQI